MVKIRYLLGTICILGSIYLLFKGEWVQAICAFAIGGSLIGNVSFLGV